MPTRRGVVGGLVATAGAALAGVEWSRADTGEDVARLLAPRALTQGGWVRGTTRANRLALDDLTVPVAPDGQFLLAFDRDAPPTLLLKAFFGGDDPVSIPLTIAPRAWAIEHVNAPLRPPSAGPDADFLARRKVELAQIKAARARETGAQGWREAMVRPAPGRYSGKFGAQRIYQGQPGAYHSGLDIAAGAGTAYVAPAAGTVVLAARAPFTLEGHLLLLDHGMGLCSAFLHAAQLLVAEGDSVAQGAPLGLVGQSGRATGPHLHWSLTWRGSRLDPLLFLAPTG